MINNKTIGKKLKELRNSRNRTFWRNVLDSVHVSPDGIEVFFK